MGYFELTETSFLKKDTMFVKTLALASCCVVAYSSGQASAELDDMYRDMPSAYRHEVIFAKVADVITNTRPESVDAENIRVYKAECERMLKQGKIRMMFANRENVAYACDAVIKGAMAYQNSHATTPKTLDQCTAVGVKAAVDHYCAKIQGF